MSKGKLLATTLVRVREDVRATLQQLAQEESVSMQEILARAVEEYRRARIFERAHEAYAALRADPEAWKQELEERRAWEATLMDGIDDEPDDRVSPSESRCGPVT
jgi:predicted kinase